MFGGYDGFLLNKTTLAGQEYEGTLTFSSEDCLETRCQTIQLSNSPELLRSDQREGIYFRRSLELINPAMALNFSAIGQIHKHTKLITYP